MRQRIDGSGVFFAWFAAVLWLMAAAAGVAVLLGTPEALTAVIGVTPPAVLVTAAAGVLLRQDRSGDHA
jgi:hypothetical protein